MNQVFITGNGFVGKNLIPYIGSKKSIKIHKRGESFSISSNIVIHLAGKAHDIKNVVEPDDYYQINTELTKEIFDAFLFSEAKVFITLSSVKAVADYVDGVLFEDVVANPVTHYGKSKFLAEQYILTKEIPPGKRVYILRPCMIHGPGNKGNLNLLYKIVSFGLPWPLGAFENKRSYCSIDNLCFIIQELIENENIPSGVYNIADDEPLSTNDLISLIASSQSRTLKIFKIPKIIIYAFAKIGNFLHLPLNTERLSKLTESYIVSNDKIKQAIGKPLPITSKEGFIKTFNSFNNA